VFELRAAIETEARNAGDGDVHRQDIARVAAGIVARRLVDGLEALDFEFLGLACGRAPARLGP
jgi:hypothetical protein